jgi:hypothetical protein
MVSPGSYKGCILKLLVGDDQILWNASENELKYHGHGENEGGRARQRKKGVLRKKWLQLFL